jgi:SAM-dependent methyltransferase
MYRPRRVSPLPPEQSAVCVKLPPCLAQASKTVRLVSSSDACAVPKVVVPGASGDRRSPRAPDRRCESDALATVRLPDHVIFEQERSVAHHLAHSGHAPVVDSGSPMSGPFSQACENNKRPILEALEWYLQDVDHVLEIGSGTGQHAVHFGCRLPHLIWQTSDLPVHHAGIRQWLEDADLPNVRAPLDLDVCRSDWAVEKMAAVFSANTAHIMSWAAVQAFIAGVGRVLRTDGWFLLYGPFRYSGAHTSDSNARFDEALRSRDPASGVRDVEAIVAEAAAAGLAFAADHAMPANNRLLVWCKAAGGGPRA